MTQQRLTYLSLCYKLVSETFSCRFQISEINPSCVVHHSPVLGNCFHFHAVIYLMGCILIMMHGEFGHYEHYAKYGLCIA